MPSTLTPKEVNSLSEYMELIEQQTQARWYRGTGDTSYELKPSLYRHPTLSNASEFFKEEYKILKRFRQRSVPYVNSSLRQDDDLSNLFFMQHFGVPTRLLDWTENPYIGLYFALTGASYEKANGNPVYTSDVAVWILDPVKWNEKASPYDPPPGIVSPPDDKILNGYQPRKEGAEGHPEPIALYGIHNSQRIVAQKGVFVLFGTRTEPMERAYKDNDYPQDCLLKVEIKKDRVSEMLDSLTRIGTTDSVVYPDLSGLALEIRRQFGFWT